MHDATSPFGREDKHAPDGHDATGGVSHITFEPPTTPPTSDPNYTEPILSDLPSPPNPAGQGGSPDSPDRGSAKPADRPRDIGPSHGPPDALSYVPTCDPTDPGETQHGGSTPRSGCVREKPSAKPTAPAGGGSPPTSLDALETSSHRLPEQTRPQVAIHARFAEARYAVWHAFTGARVPQLHRRAVKLEQCCRYPALRAKPDGEVIVCPQRCRDRCCPHCSTYRARETGARAVEAARRFDSARLLTLTVPHVDDWLPDQIAAIRAAFGRLRRSLSWKSHVRGGVYGFEVKLAASDGCWHPHLHVIADGTYYPRDELREAWRQALNHPESPWKIGPNDPLIVDARYVRNRSDVASYVAKYVAKAADLASWPPPAVREFAISMAGQRLLNTFGTMHGAKLDPRDANDDPAATTHVASITTLNIAAGRGQRSARIALLLFRLAFPKLAQWTRRDITELPPDTLTDGESIPNALARVAASAEREFWRLIELGHRPSPEQATRRPPPLATMPLPYVGRAEEP